MIDLALLTMPAAGAGGGTKTSSSVRQIPPTPVATQGEPGADADLAGLIDRKIDPANRLFWRFAPPVQSRPIRDICRP
jgi:hypothetical protein